MKLAELKSDILAIRSNVGEREMYEAADRVALALTDPSPITRERLEEMGGFWDDIAEVFVVELNESLCIHCDENFQDFMSYDSDKQDTNGIYPQPQTMGDMWCLLLRLSREEQPT